MNENPSRPIPHLSQEREESLLGRLRQEPSVNYTFHPDTLLAVLLMGLTSCLVRGESDYVV